MGQFFGSLSTKEKVKKEENIIVDMSTHEYF
jgi:hypothetical protein